MTDFSAHPMPVDGLVPEVADGALPDLVAMGEKMGLAARIRRFGADVAGLQELLLAGLKGVSALTSRAMALGREVPEVDAFVAKGLGALGSGQREVWELLALCLECGQASLRAMEALHEGNVAAFGTPRATAVRVTPILGKAILVSGHDLGCLERLLAQTENQGVHVYTHGDLFPAHAYPRLRRYRHLAGNFGGSWLDQQGDFARFPGPILLTSSCMLAPTASYRDRVFTAGMASWPGVPHVGMHDFLPLVRAAMERPGFLESGSGQTVTVGLGYETAAGAAPPLAQAVRSGSVRRLFVVGGCETTADKRGYFSRLAEIIPRDCVIFTFGCGKYLFHRVDFGTLDGLPRLMDVGQCSDMHSIVRLLLELAGALDCDVGELPMSFVFSGYGQQTPPVLLGLLSLGVEGIRVGPSLPPYLTPAIRAVLDERFGVRATTTPEDDLAAMMSPGTASGRQ